jgi:sialidase-1
MDERELHPWRSLILLLTFLFACSQTASAAAPFAVDLFTANQDHPRYSEGSIVQLRSGQLLHAITEFSGSASDFASARIIARRSTDAGHTWSPPEVLQENMGDLNVMSASLLPFSTRARSGLGLFYLLKNSPSDLSLWLRISQDDGQTFGPPERVTREPGYHVMNNDRVIQLSTGRLLCPIAWSPDVKTPTPFISFCYASDDGGQTWHRGNGSVTLPKRGAMEPGLIELKNGRIMMFLRTQLDEIYRTESADAGETWTKPEPTGIASPEAPSTLGRIPSTGDLVLVWNPTVKAGLGHGGTRTPLVAAVSHDDGTTWEPSRALEERTDQTYAYTSLLFVPDHALLSYYVRDEASGRISSRFRSLPVSWFHQTKSQAIPKH